MNLRGVWGAALAPIALMVGAGAGSAQTVDYEGGVAMDRGAFIFSEPTTSWSLSTGAALSAGRFVARVGFPVYLHNSALIAGTPVGPVPTGGSSSPTVADSGQARKRRDGTGSLARDGTGAMAVESDAVEVPPSAYGDYALSAGDPVAHVGWRILGGSGTLATVTASAKAPLSDTATVGTGEWDFGVSLAVGRSLGTWGGLSLEGSYWRLGDMPELELLDPVQGSLGIFAFLGEGWAGGTSLMASSAILDGYDPAVSLGVSLSRVGLRRTMSVFGAVGFTETAPDFSAGLSWSLRLTPQR